MRVFLTYDKPGALESPINHSLKWLEDNQPEWAKVVGSTFGIVALLEIIKMSHPPTPPWIKTASHSQPTERLGLWQKPLREPVDSKQCLLAALHCSWSSEPLFIHRHIGIQSASSLFSLITNKLQFLCMWRLKANYLWETGPEEREQPVAKWFTLRAILFYRLLNSPDHSKICMYYSAFQRKNCCLTRQPSAFWILWCIWDTLPFRIKLKSYFSVGGKRNEREKGSRVTLPLDFHCCEWIHVRNIWTETAYSTCVFVCLELEAMLSKLRFSCEGKELSPVWEIIQEHLLSSRCRDGMCEACGAKHQQVQGERTITSPEADDLWDNSCPRRHLRRWLFRVEQNCAL